MAFLKIRNGEPKMVTEMKKDIGKKSRINMHNHLKRKK